MSTNESDMQPSGDPAVSTDGPLPPIPTPLPMREPAGTRHQAPAKRYPMTPRRVICGICWALWTTLLLVGVFAAPGVGGKLGCLVLAGLAGWYDYRIWAGRAKWLTILIVF